MSAELIARLEAAPGPLFTLDLEIGDLIKQPWMAFTSSLDAALALTQKLGFTSWTIEPDAAWVKWIEDGDLKQTYHVHFHGAGKATALALCIASLKAWAERNPQTETIA